jgi:hypothetical protein
MNKKTKAIDFFDVDDLIHSSFRYYLGRRTIATCAFARDLAVAWDHLRLTTREMIGRELLKAYEEADKHPEWKPLGDDCDREAWDLVKEKAIKFLTKTT